MAKKYPPPADWAMAALLMRVLQDSIRFGDQKSWKTDFVGIVVSYGKVTVRAKRADFDALFLKYPDLKRLINDNLLQDKPRIHIK